MARLLSLVSVLWVAAASIACGSDRQPSELAAALERSAEKTQSLSNLHHEKKVFCPDCHGDHGIVPKPNDSETAENASCVRCHPYDELIADDNRLISPHRSHLGRINCTTCHHGHTASEVYCANCHIFDMHVPFEGNPTFAPPDMDKKAPVQATVDVVVIGSGGAGLSAAITAHDLGRSVIVLDKQPVTGGNTMLSAGGMNAANTRFQRALGIADSVSLMIADTMAGGGNLNDLELVTVLAGSSESSVEWLTSLGVDLSDVGKLAGASVKRAHRPQGGKAIGAHLVSVLRSQVAQRGIDVRVNSRVVKIVNDDTGKVVGVHVVGRHSKLYAIQAKAVVLAAGGFSANPERVAQYCQACAGMITSNQPGATGDGLDLGAAIDGQLVDMAQIQIHPTLAAGSRILITEAVRGNGGVLVNREGMRFVNEMATRSVVSEKVLQQTGRTAFVVFDAGVRGSLAQIEGYVGLGLVKQAESLELLAATLGTPQAALQSTLERYNQAALNQSPDPDFGRQIPRALDVAPYFAIEVAPGVHYTMGGLKIDTQTRVINGAGTPIPGFFAAGEVTGGVHGKDRLGGNSISETITFGRIAGSNAAAWAAPQPD